jgi:hypothetical protein
MNQVPKAIMRAVHTALRYCHNRVQEVDTIHQRIRKHRRIQNVFVYAALAVAPLRLKSAVISPDREDT